MGGLVCCEGVVRWWDGGMEVEDGGWEGGL